MLHSYRDTYRITQMRQQLKLINCQFEALAILIDNINESRVIRLVGIMYIELCSSENWKIWTELFYCLEADGVIQMQCMGL